MFWTFFICSLGASCAGLIGLIGLLLIVSAWQWVTGQADQVAKITDFNERSLAALLVRNGLSVEEVDALRAITSAINEYEPPPKLSRLDMTSEELAALPEG